ncbi:MAG: substrate-binding domain-containing protein [Deltaproteobacteria bacterium]|nr:substrate-binding domain-containing protein [Deltaproteobacteria bacterium]
MRALVLAIVCVLGLEATSAAEDAAFVVIVHLENPVAKLDKKTIADAFLKKRTRWSHDQTIQPVDQSKGSRIRAQFSEGVLERSIAAVRTYWNRLVFSGRGVPPPELASDADVIRYVTTRAGAIGYVSRAAEIKGVKVVQVN